MEGRLSIGAVLTGAFSTIGSNLVATLGLSFLVAVLPATLFSYFLIGSIASAGTLALFATPGGIVLYFGFIAMALICTMLVQASLVRVTVADAQGERASLGASLSTALPKILPLIGLSILMVLGLGAGLVLLIVPCIILYCMWCVATPALVAENIGIIEAFGRSRALTKGNRWKVFGLLLVLVALMWLLSAIAGVVIAMTGIAEQMVTDMASGTVPIAYLAITAVVNTLSTAFSSTLIARLYLELRTAKEGPMTDALADIFA